MHKSNRASIERHPTADDEPETTNIDKLLQLVDNTLNVYKSKHKQTKTNDKKVTNLLQTLKNDITAKKTDQLTSRRLNEGDTTNNDDLTTYYERNAKQRNGIPEHAMTQNTNENLDNTNDNSDIMKFDEDVIKSFNPDGEIVVDTKQNNDITENVKTHTSTNENSQNTNDITKLDDDLINSVNPKGEVRLSQKPDIENSAQAQKDLTENTLTDKNTNDNLQYTNSQNTNENSHNTNETPQNTNDNLELTKHNENLIKSINPVGEVVVDDSRQPPTLYDKATNDDLTTNLQTNVTDNLLDEDEEAFIKIINPAGGIVVNNNDAGNKSINGVKYRNTRAPPPIPFALKKYPWLVIRNIEVVHSSEH